MSKPTLEQLADWRAFTTAARDHADAVRAMPDASDRLPSADRLMAARKAMKGVPLPDGQQILGSPMFRLVRLVERWAVMSAHDRHTHAAELRNTAIEAAAVAGFEA